MKDKLSKLLIHLKNIIFFKFVMCLFAVIGVIVLIGSFSHELTKEQEQKNKAAALLANIEAKLKTVKKTENTLHQIKDRYDEIKQQKTEKKCQLGQGFLEYISSLHSKYKLSKPISYKVSRGYSYAHPEYKHNHSFDIEYSIVELSFRLFDLKQLVMITEDIHHSLPKGAIILKQEVKKLNTITPELSQQLEKNKPFPMINVIIKIMLRDVTYNTHSA